MPFFCSLFWLVSFFLSHRFASIIDFFFVLQGFAQSLAYFWSHIGQSTLYGLAAFSSGRIAFFLIVFFCFMCRGTQQRVMRRIFVLLPLNCYAAAAFHQISCFGFCIAAQLEA